MWHRGSGGSSFWVVMLVVGHNLLVHGLNLGIMDDTMHSKMKLYGGDSLGRVV
jgi:hypothetical protein